MKFADAHWLWALLALPVAALLLFWDERRRKTKFTSFASEDVWKYIVPEVDWSARPRKTRIWLCAIACAILALARPQWGSHEEVVRVTGLDILAVLDLSNSMETEDTLPSRLQKAKHFLRSLADRVHGDRVGIVGFAESAFLACPLTTDLDYMLETVQVLSPRSITNQGTDIGTALDTARRALDRGAEEGNPPGAPAAEAENKATRIVLLITDGEDQEGGAIEASRKLKEAGVRLYVFGIGTQKGGPIPLLDDNGNKIGFKHDRKGQVIVSHFDPDSLVSLASAGGGRYWNVTSDEHELDDLTHELGGMNRGDYAERRYLVYEERFQWPLGLALLLLLIETSLPVRLIRRSGKRQADLTPGTVTAASGGYARVDLLVLLLALIAGLFWNRAEAKQPQVGAYVENEKGVKAFNDGNMEEAKKSFGSAQALDPSLPELDFNRGVIQLQEGDMEGAAEAFGKAASDPRIAGPSDFNEGIALGKKGDYPAAIQSYLGAIDAAKRTGDGSLEKDARRNIELLMNQRKQQQQQQKQGQKGQSGSQDQQQKDQQQKDQSQKDQPDQKQAQNQPKRYQDDSAKQKQFRSQKLSRDDADRVMAELTNRDRELQNHFNRQNTNPQGVQNDW